MLSGGFFEEVKAICSGKMHQNQTENDKNIKKFRFLKFFRSFCVLFEKLGGLEKKDVQQGNHRCPGFFFEEVKANCAGETHQIHTKNDKKS